MSRPLGSFCLVLHGHIPYVLGHSTWPHGSQMLYDAVADSHMTVLQAVENLGYEGIQAQIAIGLTPVMMEQLADDRFKEWFTHYLEGKRHAAEANEAEFRSRGDLHLAYLAERWRGHYSHLLEKFRNTYDYDLLGAFRWHQDAGNIEIITSAATHGYLPLLHEDGSIQAQLMQGIAVYERHMGRRPRGCWLPECAYRPACRWAPPPHIAGTQTPYPRKGIEEFLGENGIDYFIVDTHMLGGGDPLPVRVEDTETLGKRWGRIRRIGETVHWLKTPRRPYFVGTRFEDHPPVVALVRDDETSLKVWSGEHGYPGDFEYLEFHKKHIPGDLRYWCVSDERNDLASKRRYSPDNAARRVEEHAGNFLWIVKTTLQHAPRDESKPEPVVVSPFDAELFGHWWHEGPWWLEKTLRWMHQDPDIDVATPSRYLAEHTPTEAVALPEGSWGAGGRHWVWLNSEVDWTWKRIYEAEVEMQRLVHAHGAGHDPAAAAAIQQAARELLLLQASDWQFLITTRSAPDYAGSRIHCHYSDFRRCAALARRYCAGETIEQWEWDELGNIQGRDRLFPDVDPLWFRDIRRPAL